MSKRLEVLVKYARPKEGMIAKNADDEEDEKGLTRKQRRAMGLDDEELQFDPESKFMQMFDSKNLEFFYKPYVIKIEDVHDFCPYDEEHVMVTTDFGGNLPVKASWVLWKATWEAVSGEVIHSLDSIKLETREEKIKNNGK